jgi:hypothetical protein
MVAGIENILAVTGIVVNPPGALSVIAITPLNVPIVGSPFGPRIILVLPPFGATFSTGEDVIAINEIPENAIVPVSDCVPLFVTIIVDVPTPLIVSLLTIRREFCDSVMLGVPDAGRPVPARTTDEGLPGALCVIVSVAL